MHNLQIYRFFMASREEKFTATIEINSQQAQSRLSELKKEVEELSSSRRRLT